MTEFYGVDVSKYQGAIDWAKVKASGKTFAFIRVGWCNYDGTITDGLDPYYATNMKNALAAGLDVGVYVYSYAKTEASARVCANKVLELVKPYKLTMPIAWDYEDSKLYASFGKATNNAICRAFLDTIQQANYYAILYTYTSFINAYLDWSQLTNYDKWIADYRGYCGYTGAYSIWQNSSSGSIDGISGRCDTNIMYKDLPSMIKERGLNGFTSLEFETLNNYELKISESNKREYFNSASIYDVAGKLDAGTYQAVAKSKTQYQGFDWCKFYLGSQIFYTVLDDSLSILVPGETIELESISGTIHILQDNKREYFNSANINDVAGKMPIGDYKAYRKSVSTFQGLDWATFMSEGKEYFTVLGDDLSTLTIEKPEIGVPEIPPQVTEPDVSNKDYVPLADFESYKQETDTSIITLNNRIESILGTQKDLLNTVASLGESIDTMGKTLAEVNKINEGIVGWIKGYK